MRIQGFCGGVFSRSIIFLLIAFLPFRRGWAQDLDHQQRPAGAVPPAAAGVPASTTDALAKPASTTPESLTALNSALEGLAAKAWFRSW